jgi:toxoflavin biosynthesis protein ToxC
MLGHSTVISGLATNNGYVLTAGYDNKVMLWDDAKRQCVGIGFHDHLANQVRFSPDGKLGLSTSSDYTARLWSIPRMELISVLKGHNDDIECAEFNPEKPYIATASFDDTIGIFDYAGKLVRSLSGHESDVNTIFWKSGTILVSTGDDGTIRRWDALRGIEISCIKASEVETDTICNGPDDLCFCGTDAGEIVVLGADRIFGRQQAHNAGVKRLTYVPEKAFLVSSAYDGFVKFWRVSDDGRLQLHGSYRFPAIVWPRSCSYLRDDKYVFATFGSSYATFDLQTGEWDLDGIRPSKSLNCISQHNGEVLAIGDSGILRDEQMGERGDLGELCNALKPCGPTLLAGGQGGVVWDALTGSVLYRHNSPINGGGDSKTVDGTTRTILCAYTGDVLEFNSRAGEAATFKVAKVISNNSIKGFAFGETIGLAVVATGAGVIVDLQTLEPIREVAAHDEVANACVKTKTGFASVGRDRNLVLWSRDGDIAARLQSPHFHSIKTICADGDILFLGDYRGYVSTFDLSSGTFSQLQKVSETGISNLTSVEDGRVLAASYDGSLITLKQPTSLKA